MRWSNKQLNKQFSKSECGTHSGVVIMSVSYALWVTRPETATQVQGQTKGTIFSNQKGTELIHHVSDFVTSWSACPYKTQTGSQAHQGQESIRPSGLHPSPREVTGVTSFLHKDQWATFVSFSRSVRTEAESPEEQNSFVSLVIKTGVTFKHSLDRMWQITVFFVWKAVPGWLCLPSGDLIISTKSQNGILCLLFPYLSPS